MDINFLNLCKSKKLCYVPQDFISVLRTRAEIKHQAILNKTAGRLIEAKSQFLKNTPSNLSLTLISK